MSKEPQAQDFATVGEYCKALIEYLIAKAIAERKL
jgi:hypothetical protein